MLAVGFICETNYLRSIATESRDVHEVALALFYHCRAWPDQIFLVENDEVIEHWTYGKEYRDTDF